MSKTHLIASIALETYREVVHAAERAEEAGADAIEVRLDGYEDDLEALRRFVRSKPGLTWILTCRAADEGGRFQGETRERVARLLAAARGAGAWVDFEWAPWRRSSNIRQKILLAATDPRTRTARLILSHHRWDGSRPELDRLYEEMVRQGPCGVVKVAWKPVDITDNFLAFDWLAGRRPARASEPVSTGAAVHDDPADARAKPSCSDESSEQEDETDAGSRAAGRASAGPPGKVARSLPGKVAICMGEEGLLSRVLAGKWGAFGVYAALDEKETTAPGQVSVTRMREEFRWDSIDADTEVFGVIGDPVAHSMSPSLFNRWFERHGINAVYLPLKVSGAETFKRFMEGIRARDWLGFRGFSVTIPHKVEAWRLADETPRGDVMRRIGAANTLALRDGRLVAWNTDAPAALASLAWALECDAEALSSRSVDVLGCGGAARAVVAELRNVGCSVTVFGRSPEKAARFAEEMNCAWGRWEERHEGTGRILINATNVGMWPGVDESPIDTPISLKKRELVFDLIYNPLRTRLSRQAEEAGCPWLGGLDMFVRQAATQFNLWIGLTPDLEETKSFVRQALEP